MDEVIRYLNLMRNGAMLQVSTYSCVVRYRWSPDAWVIVTQREYPQIGTTSWYNANDNLDDFFLMLQTEEIEVIGGPIEEPPKPVSHVRRVEL